MIDCLSIWAATDGDTSLSAVESRNYGYPRFEQAVAGFLLVAAAMTHGDVTAVTPVNIGGCLAEYLSVGRCVGNPVPDYMQMYHLVDDGVFNYFPVKIEPVADGDSEVFRACRWRYLARMAQSAQSSYGRRQSQAHLREFSIEYETVKVVKTLSDKC